MRHLGLALLIYAACAMRVAVWGGASAAPNLTLLVGMAALWTLGGWQGVGWLAAAGLLDDCLAGGPLGPSAGCAVLVGSAIERLCHDRRPAMLTTTALAAGAFVFGTTWLSAAMRLALGDAPVPWAQLTAASAAAAGTSAAVAAITAVCVRLVRPRRSAWDLA